MSLIFKNIFLKVSIAFIIKLAYLIIQKCEELRDIEIKNKIPICYSISIP